MAEPAFAPACAGDVAEMRAAEGSDAAFGFHLAEAGVICRNNDVASQHHLYADGKANALHRRDDRLGALIVETKGIDIARRVGFVR